MYTIYECISVVLTLLLMAVLLGMFMTYLSMDKTSKNQIHNGFRRGRHRTESVVRSAKAYGSTAYIDTKHWGDRRALDMSLIGANEDTKHNHRERLKSKQSQDKRIHEVSQGYKQAKKGSGNMLRGVAELNGSKVWRDFSGAMSGAGKAVKGVTSSLFS